MAGATGRQINTTTAEYHEEHEHLRRLRLIRAMRLGAAVRAMPQVPGPEVDDAFVQGARAAMEGLLEYPGRSHARALSDRSPAFRWGPEQLAPYGRLMQQVEVEVLRLR